MTQAEWESFAPTISAAGFTASQATTFINNTPDPSPPAEHEPLTHAEILTLAQALRPFWNGRSFAVSVARIAAQNKCTKAQAQEIIRELTAAFIFEKYGSEDE